MLFKRNCALCLGLILWMQNSDSCKTFSSNFQLKNWMLCFALAWNTRAFPLEPIKGNWGEFTAFVEKQASQSNSSSSSVGNSQHWSKLILCSEVLTQYSEGRWMQVQCGLVRTRLHQKPGCDLFFNRSPHKNFDIENLVALGAAHEEPTTLQQSNSVPPLGFQRFFSWFQP